MSGLRAVVTRVKDFITGVINPHQETDRNRNFPNSQGENRFAETHSRLFASSGGLSQKRPASHAFEPEITDDEDEEFPGLGPSYNFPVSKRQRADLGTEMSSKKPAYPCSSTSNYATRGSGRTPLLEGLKNQPWEFNFNFNNSRRKVGTKINDKDCAPKSDSGSVSVTAYAGSSQTADVNNFQNCSESTNTFSKAKVIHHIPIVRIQDQDQSVMGRVGSKEIPEVITLDDDSSSARPPVSPSRNEKALVVRPKISSPMKASKNRDQGGKILRYIDAVGKNIFGISKNSERSPSSAIRQHEKDKYKKLLEAFNVIHPSGVYSGKVPLFRSRVNRPELQVMYERQFQSSPTSGAVTITSRAKALVESTSSTSISGNISFPRLFSRPNKPIIGDKRPAILPSKDTPLVIDLEPDSNCREMVQFQPPISPITKCESSSFSSPTNSGNISAAGNYSNLEDALNNSALAEASVMLGVADSVEPTGSTAISERSHNLENDEDISIIAERIVSKSRDSSINTLALEQTSCPYVDKRWLVDSQSSWRENQKYRDIRIQEEAGTMEILNRESTLQKGLEERIRRKLTLTEIIVLEEAPAELPELDDEIMAVIQRAKARGNDNDVLAQVRLLKDTISITRGDIRTLGPSQWLNDNVINTYMGLIVLRSKENTEFPKVFAFQTFFYPKLLKEGYSNSLKRWTRKDDIFAHDLIILPIHLGLHWCLACVDFRSKSIKYFDSLGGDNNKCLNSLLDYISKEMRERKQMELDKKEWSLHNVKGIPQQENGSDCGMFACKFAEYLSRDAEFSFTQEKMPYYRDRMIYELLKQDLMYP